MTATEIAEELNDMLAGDLDEYGEEGMEQTEDAVHEAIAAVKARERIGAELARIEKEFVFAVCEPECEECVKQQFEVFQSVIKRAFDGSGIDLAKEPDTERDTRPEAPAAAAAAAAEEITWVKMKTRRLTEQELAELAGEFGEAPAKEIFVCDLPEDGENVLIATKNGYVTTDVFCNDRKYGVYFEAREVDDVKAWAHMPKGPDEEPEAEPEKFYKENPETTRRKFIEIMKQGNT